MMNERIKELAEQAGFYVSANDAEILIPDPHTEDITEVTEKFAELIVRECVKEIEFQYGGGSDQPMDDEWDRAIECVSSMVKYRFGVEQ